MKFIKRLFRRALRRVRVLFIHNPAMSSRYGTWLQNPTVPYRYDATTQRYLPDFEAADFIDKTTSKNRAKNKAARRSRAKTRGAKR